MRDVVGRAVRIAGSERTDVVAAAVLAAAIIGYQLASGALERQGWTMPVAAVLGCGAIALRRRRPFAAALSFSAALLLVWQLGRPTTLDGAVNLLIVVPPLVAYSLGARADVKRGLAGVLVLTLALQTTSGSFNPIFEMLTIGPWLAGRAVRSQRRLSEQIESRNRQLEAERTRYALESVRYERARIARELHDIVAHSATLIVIQASAGRRSGAADPSQLTRAFDAITEAAKEAETEIELLASHDTQDPAAVTPPPQTVDELVRRALAAGLPVSYHADPGVRDLPPDAAAIVSRIVQESLANAIKHAPGARIDIDIRETGDTVELEITNTSATDPDSTLAATGSGRGLAGMRDRVSACGGDLEVGPLPSGGWHVTARLPHAMNQEVQHAQVAALDLL
jgi:signal transduction histidine kinase